MAKNGDEHYREEFDAMVTRHHQMIDTIITDDKKRVDLFNNVDQLFDQLKSIYYGVYLIHDLSKKTEDTIVSYGERLSSHIVAALFKNGIRMNARDFIRTEKKRSNTRRHGRWNSKGNGSKNQRKRPNKNKNKNNNHQ